MEPASAYLRSLQGVLLSVGNRYAHVFEEVVLKLISLLLSLATERKDEDDEAENKTSPGTAAQEMEIEREAILHLISRMMLRKGTWMKSSSLSRYIPTTQSSSSSLPSSDSSSISLLANALTEGEKMSLFDIISPSSSFEDAWDAISSCFDMGDLKLLCSLLGGGGIKCTTKGETLVRLLTHFRGQRSVDGRPASARAASLVCQVLTENYSSTERMVRLAPFVSISLRRFHRLDGIAADMNALRAGQGSSIHTPLAASPALLVAFGKVSYLTFFCRIFSATEYKLIFQ